MDIEVTQHDIDTGKRDSPRLCALGLAVSRAFPSCQIFVGRDHMNIQGISVNLPAEARAFIQDFDDHIHVIPFTLHITEPPDL